MKRDISQKNLSQTLHNKSKSPAAKKSNSPKTINK